MKNYDKSLIEIWDWKEKVYQDVKDLTSKEYIEKIKKDADKTFSEHNVQLAAMYSKKEDHKIA